VVTESNRTCSLLIDTIRQIFDSGLTAGPAVSAFIDDTFFNPTLSGLLEILDDEDNAERAALLELIFFPDEAVQERLESILLGGACTGADVEAVRAELERSGLHTTISFADGRGSLEMEVPTSVIGAFLMRLNLDRRIQPKVLATIERHVPPEHRLSVQVRLRNARVPASAEQEVFLCRVLERMATDVDFFAGLDFSLAFLEEGARGDLYDSLMKRKRQGLLHLRQAAERERLLAQNNMETLMLRGERLPHIDQAELRERLVWIDRVSLAVFGKTEHADSLPQTLDCRSADDLLELTRRLLPNG
jgi:hypothetical protein